MGGRGDTADSAEIGSEPAQEIRRRVLGDERGIGDEAEIEFALLGDSSRLDEAARMLHRAVPVARSIPPRLHIGANAGQNSRQAELTSILPSHFVRSSLFARGSRGAGRACTIYRKFQRTLNRN